MRNWGPDKVNAFAVDWNAGMEAEELREKYGIRGQRRGPAMIARDLRARGLVLRRRPPGRKAGARAMAAVGA